MESKKINQLATELAPDLSDLTIIGDPTTGISKKITLSQMASLFTGTVEEYANFAAFPLVGVADTIYIALDTNVIYRWNTGTSAYVELSPNIINSLVFSDANGFDGNISLVGSVATLTITTALTTGSVPFIGSSGALSQDNANLFFDDTNNRLGINTNAPTTALDVFGSGIIGRLNGISTNNAFLGFASAGTNKWSIGNVQSDHRFRIYNEATTSELVSVLSTGEFGIGIANPTTKFHIDGAASALIANLDANVSVAKSISFRSDNSNRFNIEVSGTESGSNAGADLFIRRYSDAGALIDTPFNITRSTGLITILNAYATKINFEKTYNYITSGGTSNLDLILSGDDGIQFLVSNATVTAAKILDGGNAYFNYNLGVGTINPSTALHVSSTSTQLTLQNVNGGTNAERIGMFMTNGDTFKILSLNDNNTTRVDNILVANVLNGNIGIGANAPNYSLHIDSNTTTTRFQITNTTTGQGGGVGMQILQIGNDSTITNRSNGYLSFETVGNERMKIFSNGNVTINNTSDPSVKFQVVQTTSGDWAGDFKNYSSGAYGLRIDLSGSTGSNAAFQVYTATGSGLRLANNGSVTIGSTSNYSQYKLVLTSTGTTNATAAFRCEDSATYGLFEVLSDGAIKFGRRANSPYDYAVTGSIKAAYIDSNGGFGYNSSTRESKINIISMNNANWINKLNPVTFNKREKDNNGNYTDEFYNELHYGLIAEEVEIINTDFVFYEEKDGAKKLAGIHYDRLIIPILKLVQEQQKQIDELKALINK